MFKTIFAGFYQCAIKSVGYHNRQADRIRDNEEEKEKSSRIEEKRETVYKRVAKGEGGSAAAKKSR